MTIGKRARSAIAVVVVVIAAVAAHRITPGQAPALLSKFVSSLHGPGFAAIAVFLFYLLGARRRVWMRYLAAAAGAGTIGLISEIAQIPGPRDAQFIDLFADGIGILGALGLVASFDRHVRASINGVLRLLLPATAGVAVAITFVPSIWYAYAYTQQTTATPGLLTFEHHWESATYTQPNGKRPELVEAPEGWPAPGRTIASASESGRHGIFLSLHPAQDWRGFSAISFVAAALEETMPIAVSVRDQRPGRGTESNRHFERFEITTTPRRFYVSFDAIRERDEGRPFDFAHMEAVTFSAAKPGSGTSVLLDDIRLEP